MDERINLIQSKEHGGSSEDISVDTDPANIEESNASSSRNAVTIPPLPKGKDRHLFVSYSSEDADRVWPIVDEIEKRYNMKCIYADRDFQPGMDITQNIREGFQRSWKVLLMLSPNFTNSGWCKYEREFAFVMSIESGLSCIVPVMLEDCEVPPTLMTITYIDATQPFCDVPAKVAHAMTKTELDPSIVPFNNTKRYENGYTVEIISKRDDLWYCRPAKYRFSLDESHTKAINESKIQLPLTVLKEAMYLLNHFRAVRHYEFSASRLKLCCWYLLSFPLFFIIGTLMYLGMFLKMPRTTETVIQYDRYSSSSTENDPSLNGVFIAVAGVPIVIILVPLVIVFIPCICQRQKYYRAVHKQMWKKLARRCLKHDTILLFTAQKNRPPTLFVMRYNIAQCQEFLTCLIQAKREDLQLDESQAKDYAFDLIVQHLSEVTPKMITHYDQMPDAPYNRHNVRRGKACICQCLEKDFN